MDQSTTAKKLIIGGIISIGILGIILLVRNKVSGSDDKNSNKRQKRKSILKNHKKSKSDINTSAGSFKDLEKQNENKKKQAMDNQSLLSHQNSNMSIKSERSDSINADDFDCYQNPVKDEFNLSIPVYTSKQYRFKELYYKIFLKITKGLGYYGVVTINFTMFGFLKKDAVLEFNGTQIWKVSVNGKVVKEKDLKYQNHRIYLFAEQLNVQNNTVQICFWNKYSFFDDGLSTFFKIQNNRYSLKSQCIYTKSNKYTIPRVIPCFNQQTSCNIEVSLVHSENVIAFSNGDKRSIKSFHENDYPQFKFMHANDQTKRAKSSSRLSSRSLKQTVKNISEFTKIQLNSIEDLFVAALPFIEGKVDNEKYSNFRFYADISQKHSVVNFGNYVLNFIEESIAKNQFIMPEGKVDFIILNSDSMNGYFSKGVYIFNEKAFNHRCTKSQKVNYLLKRAFLSQFNPPSGVESTLSLNKNAAKLVPQYSNYLRVQQIKFKEIFNLKVAPQYFACYEQLYTRALKYFCPGLAAEQKVEQILEHLNGTNSSEQHWKALLDNLDDLKVTIREVIIQLFIKQYGLTNDESIRQRFCEKLKDLPEQIYFLKEEQVQQNIYNLMKDNPRRLSLVIKKLNISQEYSVAKYVRNTHNTQQCKQLLQSFLQFNQKDNFHKLQTINEQIRRIKQVLQIKQSEQQINCTLVPAMILSRLKIKYNNDDETVHKMISILNDIVELD